MPNFFNVLKSTFSSILICVDSNIILGAIKLLKKNFNINYVYLGVNQNNMRARIAFFNAGFNFYKKKNKKIIMKFNA